ISGIAGDDLPALALAADDRVLPGELQRGLGRLRAAGDEEGALEPLAGKPGEEIGKARIGLVLEDRSAGEGDFLRLRHHRLENALVAVPDIADDRPRGGVDVAPPGGIPHVDALGAVDRRAADRALLLVEDLDRPAMASVHHALPLAQSSINTCA